MLRAIIWDVDGLIVDSEPVHYRAFAEIARRLDVNLTWDQYVETYIGYDDRDVFRLLRGIGGKADETVPDVESLCAAKAEAFERIVAAGIDAMPGAVPLIHQTADQLPVAIASGATTRDLDLILGHLGVLDRFEVIVTADNVARSKPDPESYRSAAQQLAALRPELALTPDQCLAIEDTATGIASARGAGLMTLGVACTGPAELLVQADRVIDTLEGVEVTHLHDWFGT